MKKLPPPNGSTPTKKSNGSELAEVDYFKRFDDLVWIYDSQVKDYAELRHPSSSRVVRRLMEQLSPSSLEEWGDSLERLWPNEKNIYVPSRDFYVHRLSLLVDSFPSAAPHSPKVYTRMLVSCIAVKAPSCMVLESACFELTNSYKYSNCPNIADLTALVDKHDKIWDKRLEIHDEIQSGRAREFAQGRLEYEEQQERRKVERAIADLEKLGQTEMIAELNEHGIDALTEEFEDKIRKLENEAREQARIEEQKRKETDPKYKAIVAFLKQFKLKEWHHDELVEDIYKRDIPAEVIATIANGNGIPPDTLRDINEGLADNYVRTRDFIKKATFKALHLHQEQPQQGKRIFF